MNQVFLAVQKTKCMYYGGHVILGQFIEFVNVPKDIDQYECAANEIKIYRPENDIATGQFFGLYKTVIS